MAIVAAILLAAGESRRMGSPKPLLAWGDESLIEYQVRQLREAGADPVIAVTGHCADEVEPLARAAGATIVRNERFADGRATSVICGAKALPVNTTDVVVLNVDEPRPAWILRRLIAEHVARKPLISRPAYNGKRGHPPIISSAIFRELLTVREETLGLSEVMKRHANDIHHVAFDTPIVLLGMNTPEEYEAARKAFAAGDAL